MASALTLNQAALAPAEFPARWYLRIPTTSQMVQRIGSRGKTNSRLENTTQIASVQKSAVKIPKAMRERRLGI